MSSKDERIKLVEAQLELAVKRVASAEAQLEVAVKRVAAAEAQLEVQIAERDAAFGPLREENELLRHDNAQLRNQFKGFVDSIEYWKHELSKGFDE
jgi:hypothetical protein